MRKSLAHVVTVILILAGAFLAAPPANAQPTTTIAQLREDLQKTELLLQTFDNSCLIIVNGLLNEIDLKILEMRKLITVGLGNTSPQALLDLLLDALNDLTILIGSYLAGFCPDILGTANSNNDGTIFGGYNFVIGEVGALRGAGLIDNRKANKIISILTRIGGPEEVENLLADANAQVDPESDDTLGKLLEDIRACIETPTQTTSAPLVPLSNSGSMEPSDECKSLPGAPASASLATVPAAERLIPNIEPKGPIPILVLRIIKVALGFAHAIVQSVLRIFGRIAKHKKFLFLGLKETENLLRNAGFGRSHSADPVLSSGAFESVQIYNLKGQRVASVGANGLQQLSLSDGVYLAVQSIRDATGKIVRHELRKFVVTH